MDFINFQPPTLYQSGISDYKGDIYKLIADILKTDSLLRYKISEVEGRNIYKASNDSISLVFEDTQIKLDGNKVILIHGWCLNDGENKNKINDIIEKCKKYESLKHIKNNQYTIQEISKGAYRGYPGSIFKNIDGREAWSQIQSNSNKSNLALSPEQVKFLENINFPVFINGQAGSGKSEMLMYLFAELCFLKEADEYEGDPVFLTENEELLERSHLDSIEKLQFNSRYSTYKIVAEDTRKYFYTFRDFLRDNFFEEDDLIYRRIKKDSKYINFYKFKKLYEDSHLPQYLKKRYPAEIAWFVINTFIRGYSLEKEELNLDDFRNLFRKDKSFITDSIFKDIYDDIWLPFYKKLIFDYDYWDRLWLIREIFKKYESIPEEKKYTIILCDEAQDFTRLELQFLFQLSKYTEYDLSELRQVPIAFAGDPFQTVNPTGFNLSQVKRLFVDELQKSYEIKINHDFISNLNNNYRSTPEIVNLANIIQYIRYKFLEHTELNRSQIAKRISSSNPPQLIRIDRTDRHELLEKLQYEVFIAPCNNGEEKEFLDKDSFLRDDLILKSAAKAKGNEYDKVILFKFGETFNNDFGPEYINKLLNNEFDMERMEAGERFRLSFFFNKLYVAATRAKENLYILEAENGHIHFWDKIKKHKAFHELKSEQLDGTFDTTNIGDNMINNWGNLEIEQLFTEGGLEKLGVADFQTALKNYQIELDQGELYEDPEKMKGAASWLRKINDDDRYKNKILYCEARAAEFSGDFKRAGNLFKECKAVELQNNKTPFDEASKCYWIGGYWKEILNLHGRHESGLFNIRNFVSRIMLEEDLDFQALINYGKRIQNAIRGEKNIYGKIEWENEFYSQLVSIIEKRIMELSGRWKELADALKSFEEKSVNMKELIADLYYRSKNYIEAYQMWQELGQVEQTKFWECGVKSNDDINSKIFYLNKLGDREEIINIYQTNKSQIDRESLKIIGEIFYKDSDFKKLVDIQINHEIDWSYIWELTIEDELTKRSRFCYCEIVSELVYNNTNIDEYLFGEISIFGISYLKRQFNNKDFQLLTSKHTKSRERSSKVKKLISLWKPDWIFDHLNSMIKAISYSNLEIANRPSELENIILNFIEFSDNEKFVAINPLELSVCLDKTISKFSDRQRLYLDFSNLLLRSNNLSLHEKDILEERFWKIRFEINQREGISDDELVNELRKTYSRFKGKIDLSERDVSDLAFFNSIPEFTSMNELKKRLEIKTKRFQKLKQNKPNDLLDETQLKETEPINRGMEKLFSKIEHLEEQNKKLMKLIEQLTNENKKLSDQNRKLMDKLLE